jgi:hypothetical protein
VPDGDFERLVSAVVQRLTGSMTAPAESNTPVAVEASAQINNTASLKDELPIEKIEI